jgi:metal-responsive CopG/Arc/MetJ family transcriptional regulator
MKTAVSVPDEVFEEAEHLAKHLKISRSELYAKALSEFVSRHTPDTVTESFNRVCADVQGEPDPAFQQAARIVLENTEW